MKAVDSKDWRYVRDCFNKNAVLTFHGSQGARVSIEGAIEGWKAEAATFPDARRDMLRGFGQDDVVCIEIQETGTQKGTLEHAGKTYQPSGRRFKIMVCAVLRIQDHKITEASVYHDSQEYLSQLGVL